MDKLLEKIADFTEQLRVIDEQQAEIEASVEKDHEGEFTAELRAKYDDLQAKYDDVAKQKEAAEADLKRFQARRDRDLSMPTEPRKAPANSGTPASQPGKTTIPANVRRHTARNFKGQLNGRDAEERAYRFGQWCLARIAAQIPGQYEFPEAQRFYDEHFRNALATNDSNGSHNLVPEEFGRDLVDLREQYGVARNVLKVIPMMSDTRVDPRRAGGLTAYFVAEGAAGTESDKTWDNVRLTAKDLMVLSRYSAQLSSDAVISIGDDLAGEIAYAFANKEDECAFNGDGTSTYGGIQGVRNKLQDVDGAGTDSVGLVTQASGNTIAALTLADFDKVVGKLPQYADTPNACWLMHRTFYYEVVEKLVQASGGVPAYEIRDGRRQMPMFKGYPVKFSQVFPSSTAATTVFCTLGDHAMGARFGDRQQESIMFSEHASVGGQSVFERNQIAIRGTERFDINVHDVGDASTVGPIVGLQTGS